ncbi:hypothetical protein Ciccas_007193 [Cichlidogyrus casuarinus]|uniref:Uncharacterized protein n=1 Tax=Cichlidogyrus casuarinus TaxID=1844966 RepID=A0ABD2Q3K2_9PLAT
MFELRTPCIWIGTKPVLLQDVNHYMPGTKCRNWHSTEPYDTGMAINFPPINDTVGLFSTDNSFKRPCSKKCRMLCIQISPKDP